MSTRDETTAPGTHHRLPPDSALSRESAGPRTALSRESAAARGFVGVTAGVGIGRGRGGIGGFPEVTVDGAEIAPGVWVASATRDDLGDAPAHAGDLAEAGSRPRWRRGEFLAGRHLLRRLLRRVRPDLAALPLCADPAGKPRLDPGSTEDLALPGVTISHDGDRIAAAVCAHGDVGVDVQLPPARLTDSAVRRCLGPHAPAVTALPRARRAKEFAWVWTVQEACVKAAGTGLAGRPWSIDVPPGAVSGHWGGFAWLSLRTRSPVPLSCAFQPAP
jgi:4'-phosphopantetheinyl transferase